MACRGTSRALLLGGALLAGGAVPIFMLLTSATTVMVRRPSSPSERERLMHETSRRYVRLALLPGLAALAGITGTSRRNWPVLANRIAVGALAGVLGTIGLDRIRWWGYRRGYTKESPRAGAEHFGHMILGPAAGAAQALRVGYAYEYLNGIGLALTYAIVAGPGRWLGGTAWGLTIWLLSMVSPPTLITGAGPFHYRQGWRQAAVSVAAHAFFGAITGLVAMALARPKGNALDLLAGRVE